MGTTKSQNPHLAYGDLPKLIDSERRVRDVLDVFRQGKVHGDAVSSIELMCEKAQGALHAKQLFRINWPLTFVFVGRQAISLLPELQPDDFAAMLFKKSQMYGDSPIESWGEIGVMIRLDSKVKRYKNLTANPELNDPSARESVIDTMFDILGYAILGYRLSTRKMAHHSPSELDRLEQQMRSQELPKDIEL